MKEERVFKPEMWKEGILEHITKTPGVLRYGTKVGKLRKANKVIIANEVLIDTLERIIAVQDIPLVFEEKCRVIAHKMVVSFRDHIHRSLRINTYVFKYKFKYKFKYMYEINSVTIAQIADNEFAMEVHYDFAMKRKRSFLGLFNTSIEEKLQKIDEIPDTTKRRDKLKKYMDKYAV